MSWRASRTRPAALLVPALLVTTLCLALVEASPLADFTQVCIYGVSLSLLLSLLAQGGSDGGSGVLGCSQESGRLSAHSRRLQSTSLFRRQQIWCKSTQTPSRCVESLQPATLPAAFLASSIARKTSIPKKILRSCTGISPSQRTTFVLFHSREPDNILRQCADRRGQHVHRSTSTVRCWQLNDLITLQSNAPAVDFTTSEPIALLASGGNDTCALLQSNRLGARAYVLRR